MSSPAVRHTALVRITHWLTALCVLALLVSGVELIISHPRFYWGEDGNSLSPALFQLPIPASRAYVKTGYNYVLPDQNGWSRSLHFQAAWLILFTGIAYVLHSLRSGHLLRHSSYNAQQRLAYLAVVFGLMPLMIWTGLAMSPGVTAAYPFLVDFAGGQQSARTIHFFASLTLVVFVAGHIVMVIRAGFRTYVRAMITGQQEEV